MNSTSMFFPLTLPTVLERAARCFANVPVMSRAPSGTLERTNYGSIYRRALALAETLQRCGLQRGDRVATLMWTHHPHLEAYLGIPAAGGVVHPLNPRLPPDDLTYIMNHAADRFLIVDDILLPMLARVRNRVHIERVIVKLWNGEMDMGHLSYEALLETALGHFSYPVIDENEPFGLAYTSGTTGRPKAVVYSHRAIILHAFAVAMADGFGLCSSDVVLPVGPFFHANAVGLPFTATMVGARQVLPGPHLDPESLLDLLAAEQVTLTAGLSTGWLAVLEMLERYPERWTLSSRLRMIMGGNAAPEAVIRAFEQRAISVLHTWGMTETAPLATVSARSPEMAHWLPECRASALSRQGRPVPFLETRVVGEDGAELPADDLSLGELQVRGPWVAASYYNDAQHQSQWTVDGWFRTGDIVSIDATGSIRIRDRLKDIVRSGEEWISSSDLENAIMGHPGVKEAAVVGILHPHLGEQPLAVVVGHEGCAPTAVELRNFLGKHLPSGVPLELVFVSAIPRTATGKFLKTELRVRFRDYVALNQPLNVSQCVGV